MVFAHERALCAAPYLALHSVIVGRKPMDRSPESLPGLKHLVVLTPRVAGHEHSLGCLLLHALVPVMELHLGRRHLAANAHEDRGSGVLFLLGDTLCEDGADTSASAFPHTCKFD